MSAHACPAHEPFGLGPSSSCVRCGVLSTRSDETVKAEPVDQELRRARALWRIDTYRQLLTTEELERLADAGDCIAGGRS